MDKDIEEISKFLDNFKNISDNEIEHVYDTATVVWKIFGLDKEHDIETYLLPMFVAFKLFKIKSRSKRLKFFKNLIRYEDFILSEIEKIKPEKKDNYGK